MIDKCSGILCSAQLWGSMSDGGVVITMITSLIVE